MFRPRSIATLILIGLSVTLTPLIAALITAVVQVDGLAALGRDTVHETQEVTAQSRSLLDGLIEMRRPFMQYQVTGDADFYAIYLERRAAFVESLRGLDEQQFTPRAQEHLADLVGQERAVFESVPEPAHWLAAPAGRGERAWIDLSNAARAVLAESAGLIDTRVDNVTRRADTLQRAMLVQAAALIPGTIFLAALFFGLVTRPMKQIGRAIRRLGAQDFDQPIAVRGPSDVQELGELLDWLRQRIQQLEQQKIAFLRHISHELKTPLTTIRSGSELLVEGLSDGSEESAEIAKIIHANGLQLQRLIEDLLRFSETQNVVTDLELVDAVDLEPVIRGVLAAQTLVSGAKDIDLTTDLEPVRVRGDPNKLRIVVDNLLTNATKYTPRGGRIRVALRAAGSCAVLDVEDNGPGVDESETERIFEPFQQGSAEYRASVKGTGLGLSIAKEYVEAHDGHIRVVDSTVGAHFRVSVPIAGPRGVPQVSRGRIGGGVLVGM
jgi:two-component system sensor histidine kinase GlrK